MRPGPVDAPAVVGWGAWKVLVRRHGLGLCVEGWGAAVVADGLQGDPETLAVMINGALNYGVVWAGHGEGPEALARLKSSFVETMARLRR